MRFKKRENLNVSSASLGESGFGFDSTEPNLSFSDISPGKIATSFDDIRREVRRRGKYKAKGIELYPRHEDEDEDVEEDEDAAIYVGKLTANNVNYIGGLSKRLIRNDIGINKFENGDIYYGYFDNNYLVGHGFYRYDPKEENGKLRSNFYWGYWNKGKKDGRGLSISLLEEGNSSFHHRFDHIDFEGFMGIYQNNKKKSGLYLKKESEDKYYVYFGDFNDKEQKEGDNCFFFNAEKEMALYGKVIEDKFVSGYVGTFDDQTGELNNLKGFIFSPDNEVEDITESEKIENEKLIEEKFLVFRNIIMEADIFGDLFGKMKEGYITTKNAGSLKNFQDVQYQKSQKFLQSYISLKYYDKLKNSLQ